MGYPFPKAPLADGTGTTPQDMQRIVGAMYHNEGIVPGTALGGVSGTSGMSYATSACAVFMWANAAARLGYLVPVEATTVLTAAAPGTGTRTDYVYVNSNGGVVVKNGGSAPSGVILGEFDVPAGATSTQSLVNKRDRIYAIPAGASLGQLYSYHDPTNGPAPSGSTTRGAGRFVLSTDRIVRFDLTHCVSAIWDDALPGQQGDVSIVRWRIFIDDVQKLTFTTRVEWDNAQTNFLSFSTILPAGEHRVHYIQELQEGDPYRIHKGGSAGFIGNRFEVWDGGVSA